MFFLAPIKTEWCMKCYYDNKIFTFTWLAFIHFYLFPQNNFIFLECAQFLSYCCIRRPEGDWPLLGKRGTRKARCCFQLQFVQKLPEGAAATSTAPPPRLAMVAAQVKRSNCHGEASTSTTRLCSRKQLPLRGLLP